MSIAKPFTFTANTYAKASEVNADFDVVYSQVNTNISDIAQNATDIDNLENNKANINGSTSQRFAVADAVSAGDAINKQTLMKSLSNSIDYISGLIITKDSGSPEDTIIVSAGSAYDSTKTTVLSLANSLSKQNTNQAASATYYVYIIGSSGGSQTDILISPNQVTPTLPTGYTLYRQIGSYTTDSDNKINSISYYGLDVNGDKSIDGIADSLMPDWDTGVSKAFGTVYTADKPGYVVMQSAGMQTSQYLYCSLTVNDIVRQSAMIGAGSAGQFSFCVPVSTGDTYKGLTDGTGGSLVFYPIKGVV